MTERLDSIAPDLVARLTSLPEDEQRRIAVALAEAAARRSSMSEDVDVESGEATERDYLDAFEQARAAWAMHFSAAPDSRTAVLETAYEAQAALGSLDEFRGLLGSLLA